MTKDGGITMAENVEAVQSPDFKDRKVRLVVLGIVQIIFGGFCALMIPLMLLGMIASAAAGKGAEGIGLRTLIPAVLVYVALAVWFVWMGIGSVMTRRWARALILVNSWIWLICGACGMIFVLMILPGMYDKMGESGQMPKGAVIVAKYVVTAVLVVIYLIIPGIFVLCYSGKDVKATCEYRDLRQRWTDKSPLPVLAVSLMAGFWAVSMLFMGIYRWTIPFFGIVLSGVPGAIAALILALLFGYAAWGTYKLNMTGWWCVLLLSAVWFLSTIITFSNVDMQTYYEKMGFSMQQLEMMKQYNALWGSTMNFLLGFWAIAVLLYLMYIRRYFIGPSSQNPCERK
jgi:hypothetical protein